MDEQDVARCLQTAELWELPPDADSGAPILVAGWEDGASYCTAVCSTDVGLAFCRQCPAGLAARVIRTGRPASEPCPAGVRMLAFPAPAHSRRQAAVLRIAPPEARDAARVTDHVRVSPATLRRAAADAERPGGRTVLAAARVLRSADSLFGWTVGQRDRGADRRRTATAALAQMIATSDEFHVLYQASQRQRKELERNQRRLDRLARESLRTQDVERARIAHQIHDTAAQSMVSAYRFLDAARASSAAGGRPDTIKSNLASAAERLQAAIGEVRAVLASLVPPGLEELGIAPAIARRLGEITAGTRIAGNVTGDLPRLEGWVEQAIYGMAVEAISNAVRHGEPRAVTVELTAGRQRGGVTIHDDGKGFDPGAAARRDSREAGGGLGLLGLSRQASWLGGRATVRSRPGAGTTIRISVPLGRWRRADWTDSAPASGPASEPVARTSPTDRSDARASGSRSRGAPAAAGAERPRQARRRTPAPASGAAAPTGGSVGGAR